MGSDPIITKKNEEEKQQKESPQKDPKKEIKPCPSRELRRFSSDHAKDGGISADGGLGTACAGSRHKKYGVTREKSDCGNGSGRESPSVYVRFCAPLAAQNLLFLACCSA